MPRSLGRARPARRKAFPRPDTPREASPTPLAAWAETHGVTAAELRVVGQVARGLSNKEVGNALGVSPATVRAHLLNACRKIGVRSRGELAHVVFTVMEAATAALATERGRLLVQLETERNLLSALLRQSPIATLVAESPSGAIVLANEAAAALAEMPPTRIDSIASYPLLGARGMDGRRLAADEYSLARALRGETVRQSLQRVRADGSVISIEAHAVPVQDELGRIVAALCLWHDVTHERRVEASLRARETRFRVMAENIPDAIFTASADGALDYVNGALPQFTGLSPGAFLGNGWLEVIAWSDRAATEAAWRRSLETLEPLEHRCRVQSISGAPHWFIVRARPSLDVGGRAKQWLGTLTEIDTLMKAEHAMHEALASREDFFKLVSRDLKAPADNLVHMGELLRSTRGAEESAVQARRLGGYIARAAGSLRNLAGDVLELGDLESGHLVVRPTQLSVGALLEQVRRSLGTPANELTPQIVAPDEGVFVLADPTRIMSVFQVLVSRALKVSRPDRPVVVSATSRSGDVEFSVADSGPPLPREHLTRIFDRLWLTSVASHRGVGLGFVIAKRIVESHLGHLTVETSPSGSTFRFTLPTS